jgi:uncharacterized RDD family membrane protein YckC
MNAPATPPDALVFGPHLVPAKDKASYFQKFFEGVPMGLQPFAGMPKRFGADLIDGILLLSINVPLIVGSIWILFDGVPDFSDPVTRSRMNLAYMLLQLFGYGVNLGYNTWMVGKYGATLGKMAMGIRVVRSNGDPLTYPRALGRALAEFLSAFTFYIGYFMAFLGKERAALHDFICDTRIVEAHPSPDATMRCASCNATLPSTAEADSCTTCNSAFTIDVFPAALRQQPIPHPAEVEGDQASCFYHPNHIATHTCTYSGRYLCDLCDLSYRDHHYSAQSLWELRKQAEMTELLPERRLVDPLVSSISLIPLSLPVTFALAVYGFMKPGRLLGGTRMRLIVAVLISLLQVIALVLLILYLI